MYIWFVGLSLECMPFEVFFLVVSFSLLFVSGV